MKKDKMKCEECGKMNNLMNAVNDLDKKVYICKECYNMLCEGYRLIN